MTKKELLTELEDRGFDFDTRALICDDVLDIINKQIDKTIKPKYKVGDKAYAIIDTTFYTAVYPVTVVGVNLIYKVYDGRDTTMQHFSRLFDTEQEAEQKLKEMQ